ncbi:MAG: spore protease YyaC [Clostridiales bacterium]|nr:spore protease YyaC [Clostridiales bacterium]
MSVPGFILTGPHSRRTSDAYGSHPLSSGQLAQLLSAAEAFRANPVILCIGTDRIVGDSLGPLTGTLLQKRAGNSLAVYGTLDSPVHACNLAETLAQIKKEHPDSAIIAVDASLGSHYKVGSVLVRPGSIRPGLGVRKDLPAAGDISIIGIAGVQSRRPYLVLQTVRLSVIMSMAEQICDCILGTIPGGPGTCCQAAPKHRLCSTVPPVPPAHEEASSRLCTPDHRRQAHRSQCG